MPQSADNGKERRARLCLVSLIANEAMWRAGVDQVDQEETSGFRHTLSHGATALAAPRYRHSFVARREFPRHLACILVYSRQPAGLQPHTLDSKEVPYA